MNIPAPHFLLYAEAALQSQCASGAAATSLCRGSSADASLTAEGVVGGRWRFVLQLPGGETSLEAADDEAEATPERLELLAVVRGLEALDQPSRVTLVTGSRFLRRGLDFGLSQWRENDWQWERYGRMTAVKNADLWQRLDRLLAFHTLECRPSRLESAHDLAPPPASNPPLPAKRSGRSIRIDAPHAATKQQISNHKSQPISKGPRRNDAKSKFRPAQNSVNLNLLGHWSVVIGHWLSSLAHWLQTRGKES
jgi:ribonuclease HI